MIAPTQAEARPPKLPEQMIGRHSREPDLQYRDPFQQQGKNIQRSGLLIKALRRPADKQTSLDVFKDRVSAIAEWIPQSQPALLIGRTRM